MKITYNKRENTLTITEDGKPVCGIIGYKSEAAFKKLMQKQLCALNDQLDALNKWLYDKRNIDDPQWPVHMRLARNICVKIEQIKSHLDKKNKDYGYCEYELPAGINLKP